MTCIVGVVADGKVHMGADSCGSNHTWRAVENPKVFAVGDMLIGCTGTFRMIDVLRYQVAGVRRSDENDDRYIRFGFCENVRRLFQETGLSDGKSFNGSFLVGYKGHLYEIVGDFGVLNCPGWGMSVGSGEEAARGSLWTTREMGLSPEQRISHALESAEAVIPSVRRPFVFRRDDG